MVVNLPFGFTRKVLMSNLAVIVWSMCFLVLVVMELYGFLKETRPAAFSAIAWYSYAMYPIGVLWHYGWVGGGQEASRINTQYGLLLQDMAEGRDIRIGQNGRGLNMIRQALPDDGTAQKWWPYQCWWELSFWAIAAFYCVLGCAILPYLYTKFDIEGAGHTDGYSMNLERTLLIALCFPAWGAFIALFSVHMRALANAVPTAVDPASLDVFIRNTLITKKAISKAEAMWSMDVAVALHLVGIVWNMARLYGEFIVGVRRQISGIGGSDIQHGGWVINLMVLGSFLLMLLAPILTVGNAQSEIEEEVEPTSAPGSIGADLATRNDIFYFLERRGKIKFSVLGHGVRKKDLVVVLSSVLLSLAMFIFRWMFAYLGTKTPTTTTTTTTITIA